MISCMYLAPHGNLKDLKKIQIPRRLDYADFHVKPGQSQPEAYGMFVRVSLLHTIQTYPQYVKWYISMQEQQREFGLPILSADHFEIKEQEKPAPIMQPQYPVLPKPNIPNSWSSAVTQQPQRNP